MRKSLLISIISSFLLLVGIICLIWWNETVGFKCKKLIHTINVGTVEVDKNIIDSNNDGKLIVVGGDINYTESANDYEFDVYVNSPKIRRLVEVYQYEEKVLEDGSYTYEKVWDSSYINSNKFNDKTKVNSFTPKYKTKDFYAENLSIGKYKFSESLKEQINLNETYKELDPIIGEAYGLKVNGIYYTNSEDINNPEIGDFRISFVYSEEKEGTILAMQSFDSFIKFTTNKGITYNKYVPRIATKKAMVAMISNDNDLLRWELRFSLALFLFLLAFISFRPITKLNDNLFFFGRISSRYLIILCILFSLFIYFIEAGLVWAIYSPLITLVLFVFVVLIALIIFFSGKRNYVLTAPIEEETFEPEVLETAVDNSISGVFNNSVQEETDNNGDING